MESIELRVRDVPNPWICRGRKMELAGRKSSSQEKVLEVDNVDIGLSRAFWLTRESVFVYFPCSSVHQRHGASSEPER